MLWIAVLHSMGWSQEGEKWTVPALTSVRLGMIALLVIVSTLLLTQLFIDTGRCIFIISLPSVINNKPLDGLS